MENREALPLIPYPPPTSREVVLQHGSSIVVYDPQSKQVSLWDEAKPETKQQEPEDKCPMCGRRPLDAQDSSSQEPPKADPSEQVMNAGYFRLLNHRISGLHEHRSGGTRPRELSFGLESPSSQPEPINQESTSTHSQSNTYSSQGISSTAFSQNYFRTFFAEEGELGRGGKGVVLLVRHVLDGVSLGHFACKRVPVGDNHDWLKRVLVEVQLLQGLSHQNLVSYRHVWLEDCQLTKFGPSVPCAFILQQYCNGGDLLHYILAPKRSSEELRNLEQLNPFSGARLMNFDDIFSFFKDITAGLHHLHSNGYLHRDLKPSNCLLHDTGTRIKVLVSDFGEVQEISDTRRSTGATGTLSYCAPEVLRPSEDGTLENFTVKSDIFSLGMIVYFMCFAQSPFKNADDLHDENEDMDALRQEICEWQGFGLDEKEKRHLRPDLPDDLYRVLKRLLSLDPFVRPDTAEILQGITFKAPNQRSGSPRPTRGKRNSTGKAVDNQDSSGFAGSFARDHATFQARSSSSGTPRGLGGGPSSRGIQGGGSSILKKGKKFQAHVTDDFQTNTSLEKPYRIRHPTGTSHPSSVGSKSPGSSVDGNDADVEENIMADADGFDSENRDQSGENAQNRVRFQRRSFAVSNETSPLVNDRSELIDTGDSPFSHTDKRARRHSVTAVHELDRRALWSYDINRLRSPLSPDTKTPLSRPRHRLPTLSEGYYHNATQPFPLGTGTTSHDTANGRVSSDDALLTGPPVLLSPLFIGNSHPKSQHSRDVIPPTPTALVPLSQLPINSASSIPTSSEGEANFRNARSFPMVPIDYSSRTLLDSQSRTIAIVVNAAKVALFLVKYHIINGACLSHPRSVVSMPLMVFALVDFMIPIGWNVPRRGDWNQTSGTPTAKSKPGSPINYGSTASVSRYSNASVASSKLPPDEPPPYSGRPLSSALRAVGTSIALTAGFWMLTVGLREVDVLCYF